MPKGKAVRRPRPTSPFEARRADYEAKAQANLGDAEARRAKLEGASVTCTPIASTEGKLYGSVGPRDIAEALTKLGTRWKNRKS